MLGLNSSSATLTLQDIQPFQDLDTGRTDLVYAHLTCAHWASFFFLRNDLCSLQDLEPGCHSCYQCTVHCQRAGTTSVHGLGAALRTIASPVAPQSMKF
jgi:hypothetical protein